jgi:hypothetical protein
MIGRKTLAQIRAELEAALGRQLADAKPPAEMETSPGRLTVWESLRRFLEKASADAGVEAQAPSRPPQPTSGPPSSPRSKPRRRGRAAGD